MTNHLAGRALDEAVAKAMGWKDIAVETDVDALYGKDPRFVGRRVVPQFSTDAAHIPEMLAWLQARAYSIEGYWTDATNTWCFRATWNEGLDASRGATLQEALARLVAAVAEAR